jgi:bifunctional N-acetylglucosamine-1-phosphate-uridyltransferase/glucosamine-1-phosphate-acetyltransferase GlmU-like protein
MVDFFTSTKLPILALSPILAPVTIGKNATIGAGSTITKDVPDGQLSLSRAKQAVLKNWHKPVKVPITSMATGRVDKPA